MANTHILTFQFTLPCGERQNKTMTVDSKGLISIHAPVWGATNISDVRKRIEKISIHAPVWGAT